MTEEERLVEKLQHIERLFAGAATPGERDAAARARERIAARLKEQERVEPAVEYTFTMRDRWSHRLLVALLRRHGLRPYRYPRQRYTTTNAKVPASFVNETLWPEFVELQKVLVGHLNEVANRVIAQGVTADDSEVEVRPQTASLGMGSATMEQS